MARQKRSIEKEKHSTVKVFDTEFARRLSMLVKNRNEAIGKNKLAEELKVTKRTIELWEAQQSRPDIDRLKELADYFEVTVDYLVGKSDSVTPTLEDEIATEIYGLSVNSIKQLKKLQDSELCIDKDTIRFLNLILESLEYTDIYMPEKNEYLYGLKSLANACIKHIKTVLYHTESEKYRELVRLERLEKLDELKELKKLKRIGELEGLEELNRLDELEKLLQLQESLKNVKFTENRYDPNSFQFIKYTLAKDFESLIEYISKNIENEKFIQYFGNPDNFDIDEQ